MSGDWLSSAIQSNGYGNTYIKGFLDISGGNLLLRNGSLFIGTSTSRSVVNGRLSVSSDTSFVNLYTTGSIGIPAIQVGKSASRLSRQPIYAFDVSGKTQITNSNTVSINCPSTFLTINQSVNASLINQYDSTISSSQTIMPSIFDWYSDIFAAYIYSNYSIYNPVITFSPNVFNNKNIYLPPSYLADCSCSGRFGITDAATYNGNAYLYGGFKSTADVSLNRNLYTQGTGQGTIQVTTFNGRLYVGPDVVSNGRLFSSVGSDVSCQGNLYVNSLYVNGNLFVPTDTPFGGKLDIGQDVSVNGFVFVNSDASINGNVAIAKDLRYGGVFTNPSSANFTINLSAFIIPPAYSSQFMDTSTNQTANGKKTFGGVITASYDVSMVSGNAYVAGKTITGTTTTVGGRAFIGKDVSLNGRVFVNMPLIVGQGTGLGTQGQGTQGFILDTSSANINGYGAAHIYESIQGTLPTASGGTLVIQHADVSGVSSIVFPSVTNYSYGSVAYYDTVYGVPGYNYYNTTQSTSSSALVLKGEPVILQAAGSVIVDTSQTLIQPGGGPVGIGKTAPSYALDISGVFNSTQTLSTSDYRIKENVVPLAVQSKYSVDNLKPLMYTNTLINKEDIGFLAHELQEEYPFLVLGEKDARGNYQSINYAGIIAILVAEVKRLKRGNQGSLIRLRSHSDLLTPSTPSFSLS
jgi:hypothetical protein